jgi:putative transcriptional regulator
MIAGTISNRVRLLRFTNGEMSQEELGVRVGVTRQTIAAIEAGKYSPSLETAFRIAHVFGVPIGDAFNWSLRNGASP